MPYARIAGTGGYLPTHVVTNDELAADLATRGVETSDAWITERTGIRQRHIADPGTKTSTLATAAAQAALENAGLRAEDIDLIIVATSTPDFIFPSTACVVQANLGVGGAAAFDIQAVCSGFVYAMATADAMIRAGRARHALVIGAEVFSGILDWSDRRTCVLFGDGAGAMILSASDQPGILAAQLNADGRQQHILCAAGNVSGGQITGDPFLRMDGQAVFKLAVNSLTRSARQVCEEAGVQLSELDWMVPHQANIRILNFIGRKLDLPEEKLIVTLDRHANTSAASVPLAFDVAWRDGRMQAGQLVLLQGVGGGFTWGSVLVKL
ncbi:beta-ketoacyl-ACP synthase III [Castellaniella sp.]|uniref:beta-ketoacyl-ACP synthase III n=1 Tax=Castellaniella sp. TaxID=1955812 RepID=UPI002B001803|nr:beta-ketoacyl-ACP synthase III [Castellaniella sp.]